MSVFRNRHCRPTRTAGILPALMSQYTVRRLTWRYWRTSSVVQEGIVRHGWYRKLHCSELARFCHLAK